MEKSCFTITGEFLTDIARQLHADERNTIKALKILESAFPDMTESVRFSILCGDKKLIGDSRSGLELVEDGSKVSKKGNTLTMSNILEVKEKELKITKAWGEIHTGQVVSRGSVEGLVNIPVSMVDDFESGKDLKEIPHARVTRREAYFNPVNEVERSRKLDGFEHDEGSNEVKKYKVPRPDRFISTGSGWLSPDGKFYRCEWMAHIKLANALGHTEKELEKLGWVKITSTSILLGEKELTQRQYDLVFDYCKETGKSCPLLDICLGG